MKHLALLAAAAAALAGGLAASASAAQFEANAQSERVIGNIIDGLIGNRYNVSDRQAVRTCAWAAVRKAENQYRPEFRGRPFAYPGYRGYVRVTAITDVQRRLRVVRVRGLMDTARFGYRGGRYGADLSFRCDVDRRGRVETVRIERNPGYRPR
jgi:hypothetical protein